jgi:phage repressor protein C with HTH and peptisase S24 domain
VEVKGGLAFKRDWLASLGVKPENALVIYASGDSMAPTIQDGAVVLLDRSQTEVRNGKTYAFLAEDEVRIKRVFRSLAGVWTLASDNPNKAQHPDEEIEDPSTLSVIGRCVWQGGAL